jgi:hypothetical protein
MSSSKVRLHHERRGVMRGLNNVRGWVGLGLMAVFPAHAGQYQLMLGQAQSVPIAVPVRNSEAQCHVQLQVAGQPPVERVVKAPLFETRLLIRPDQAGPVLVRWIGTSKRVGGEVVNACPTEGQTELNVVAGNEALVADWNGLFARLGPALSACVRSALDVQQVRYAWFDMRSVQTSGEDAKIDAALQQCDAFVNRAKAWAGKDPARHACALPSGQKTECEGYYAEAGKSGKVISQQQAIAHQLQGLAWTTGVREQPQVKAQRLKREHAEQLRLEAEAAAKLEAEAKLQRDEEARRVAEAKAQEEAAEAEKARVAEQKEKEEKERLENRSWFAKTYDGLKEKAGRGHK